MNHHHKVQTVKLSRILRISGLCAFLFMLCAPLAAQEDTREDLHFGVKAGANYSNVWDERGEDFRADGKFGFAGGVWLGVPIGTYLGIQPEVLIAQKGFKGRGTLFGSKYVTKTTTTHLEIPLLVQFKPLPFITVVGGPQYSFLLGQKDSFSWENNTLEQEQAFDNDNIRKNMFGFVIGLDVVIHPFVLATRAGWDITQNHGDGSSSNPRYKNRWIQVMAGFQF